MNFLLDTDMVSYALRGAGRVGERLRQRHPSESAISVITAAELRFGADRLNSLRLHRLVDAFTRDVRVLPFPEPAARRFGVIAAMLERQGRAIGVSDCLIAAHALTLGLTLVTNNVRHFARIRGLKLENWLE